jgi:hypothetical protein
MPVLRAAAEAIVRGGDGGAQHGKEDTSPTLVTDALSMLRGLQSRALKPWRDEVLRRCAESALPTAALTEAVLSAGLMVCRREAPVGSGSDAPVVAFPARPSPCLVRSLLDAAHCTSSLLRAGAGGPRSSAAAATAAAAPCPSHVIAELRDGLAAAIVQRAADAVERVERAALPAEERDLRLLQLLFDARFAAAVLSGNSNSAVAPSPSALNSLTQRVKGVVDRVTLSATDGLVSAALRAAVDQSAAAFDPLLDAAGPLRAPPDSASRPGAGLVTRPAAAAAVEKPRALAAVEPCERLPLLPLVTVTAAAAANAGLVLGSGGGDGRDGDSSSIFGGGAGGATGGIFAGVGNAAALVNGSAVSSAAQSLLAQGSAITSRLRDVFAPW